MNRNMNLCFILELFFNHLGWKFSILGVWHSICPVGRKGVLFFKKNILINHLEESGVGAAQPKKTKAVAKQCCSAKSQHLRKREKTKVRWEEKTQRGGVVWWHEAGAPCEKSVVGARGAQHCWPLRSHGTDPRLVQKQQRSRGARNYDGKCIWNIILVFQTFRHLLEEPSKTCWLIIP